jgi:hypothetical protein
MPAQYNNPMSSKIVVFIVGSLVGNHLFLPVILRFGAAQVVGDFLLKRGSQKPN